MSSGLFWFGFSFLPIQFGVFQWSIPNLLLPCAAGGSCAAGAAVAPVRRRGRGRRRRTAGGSCATGVPLPATRAAGGSRVLPEALMCRRGRPSRRCGRRVREPLGLPLLPSAGVAAARGIVRPHLRRRVPAILSKRHLLVHLPSNLELPRLSFLWEKNYVMYYAYANLLFVTQS